MRGDLTDLIARFKREGFQYLSDAEAQELLTQAVEEVGYDRQWPERIVTSSSIPPVADTGGFDRVLSVSYDVSGVTLEESERIVLRRSGAVLSQAGAPSLWYFTGTGAIATWPMAVTSVTVEALTRRLWALGGLAPQDGTDTPMLPQGARSAAVQLAAAKAHEENGAVDLGSQKRAVCDQMVERAFVSESRRVTQRSVRVID